MKTKNNMIFIAIALLVLVVVVSACTNNAVTPVGAGANNPATVDNAANPAPNTNNPAPANQNTATQKLSDSRYANNAYLISGDALDAAAQQAISGFNIDKTTNADGTTTFRLSSSNPEYQNQSYTLQPGQKLYFIEANLGDDGNNNEGFLGDDKALITDADGNIIQMPTSS